MSEDPECVFCQIVAGTAPAEILHHWSDAIAITPLNPVVPGHVLVISRRHVADFTEPLPNGWTVISWVVQRAAEYAAHTMGDCNLITSKGPAATQTVMHLHVHLIPRHAGDGLTLPWTGQATDGRGGFASFTSANGATDHGGPSAGVAPADPSVTEARSVSVPLGGAS